MQINAPVFAPTGAHPDYLRNYLDWQRFRYVARGGLEFLNAYLEKFSDFESDTDFAKRRSMSYTPSHAKAALNDVQNAIVSRMQDIVREGGSESYQRAVEGVDLGVDLQGSSMNTWVATQILPELLSMGKVGVCVDRSPLSDMATLYDTNNSPPYLYRFICEQIINWSYDARNVLVALQVQAIVQTLDPDTGLVVNETTEDRYYRKMDDSTIRVTVKSENGDERITYLNLPMIPFVIFQLPQSLLFDVANHDIALLNLASSDMNYAFRANFPLYVEESTNASIAPGYKPDAPVNSTGAVSADPSIKTGPLRGRRVPRGAMTPTFIHPSSEPLEISMKKQEKIELEIRKLVNLAITSFTTGVNDGYNDRGLEAGLAYIAMVLQAGERQIAKIWASYEKYKPTDLRVSYPENYAIKTEKERKDEIDRLNDSIKRTPSVTFQRELAKRVAELSVGALIKNEVLQQIKDEIDDSDIINLDPADIRDDHAEGLVSAETASRLKGYPEGDVLKAQEEHAKRAAIIAMSQSTANQQGVSDNLSDPGKQPVERKAADTAVPKSNESVTNTHPVT